MSLPFVLAAALAAAGPPAVASPSPTEVAPAAVAVEAPPAPVPAPAALVLPKGTMIRLMVLNEVNSRDHQVGHRFVLRVDEDVRLGQATIIPVGAKAWGEVVGAKATGGAGKGGRLNARLLYVEANGRKIPLDGERQSAGNSSTAAVVTSVIAFGPFGLLMKGNNAKLKAGEILNGYTIDDVELAPPSGAAP